MSIRKQTMEGVQNNILESMAAELSNDNDIIQPILGKDILEALFQLDEPIPLDDYSLKGLNAWEDELRQLIDVPAHGGTIETTSNLNFTTNSSEKVDVSVTQPGLVSQASTFTFGEGSSLGGGNRSVVNSILSSQNSLNLLSVPPSAMNSTAIGLRTIDRPGVGASSGNFMFPNAIGNSLIQFQSSSSSSFSKRAYGWNSGNSNSSNYRFNITGTKPLGTPANALGANTWLPPLSTTPHYNQGHSLLPPPSTIEFYHFVEAWEGYLIGKIHSHRSSFNTAKARRRPTSPVTLTAQWSYRLEIAMFIPKSSVDYTIRILGGPIDYMFFLINQFNNVNLFDFLTSKNLCAKIQLPSQTIILSPTESKYHFLGSVFQGDMIFLEPSSKSDFGSQEPKKP